MKGIRASRAGATDPGLFRRALLVALCFTAWAIPSAHAARFVDFTLPAPDTAPQIFTIRFDGDVQFRQHDGLLANGYYYVDFYGVPGVYPQREWRPGREGISVVRQISYPEHGVLRFVFYTFQNLETTAEFVQTGPGAFRIAFRKLGADRLELVPAPRPPGERKIVFIDPGHGGHNHGGRTSSPINGRTYLEKDVTLAIARRMVPLFQRSPNLEVRLSRVDDRFVSLDDRIRLSDVSRADLFVSIHTNATNARRKTARGCEVFYLSDDRQATNRWLEVMENTQGLGDVTTGREGQQLRKILTDISDRDFARRRAESQLLANVVERTFARQGPFRTHIRGSKPAAFRVLMNYNAPAVLVECGFLDNPQDAALLVQPRVQDEIAALLFNAINLYFARTDPTFQPYAAPVGR
jgi:N-acetylmuramoyl-L-alanine amidase